MESSFRGQAQLPVRFDRIDLCDEQGAVVESVDAQVDMMPDGKLHGMPQVLKFEITKPMEGIRVYLRQSDPESQNSWPLWSDDYKRLEPGDVFTLTQRAA